MLYNKIILTDCKLLNLIFLQNSVFISVGFETKQKKTVIFIAKLYLMFFVIWEALNKMEIPPNSQNIDIVFLVTTKLCGLLYHWNLKSR
jgi:hypothetical protein